MDEFNVLPTTLEVTAWSVVVNFNTHRVHPIFTTLTVHGGNFLPPDEKSIISRTP